MFYNDSRVFNSGEFKINLYFHFRVPPTPARAPPEGGLGGPEGGLVLHYQKSCVISILRFSIVGISKMISIFTLGYPRPPQRRPQGEGSEGGLVLYYQKSCVISILRNFIPISSSPPPKGRPYGGQGYPKIKIKINFELLKIPELI